MSNVKSFKLVTGEEVVAELKSIKEIGDKIISYNVRRPYILSFQSMALRQLGLAFIPWTLSNPDIDTIEIPANSVIAYFDPAEKVLKQYLEQISGISIAPTTSTIKM